jgi:hypothetical protein
MLKLTALFKHHRHTWSVMIKVCFFLLFNLEVLRPAWRSFCLTTWQQACSRHTIFCVITLHSEHGKNKWISNSVYIDPMYQIITTFRSTNFNIWWKSPFPYPLGRIGSATLSASWSLIKRKSLLLSGTEQLLPGLYNRLTLGFRIFYSNSKAISFSYKQ